MGEGNSMRLRGAKARVGSIGLVWALALGMAAASLGLAWPRGAVAAPDPPYINGPGAFFEGNQSQGIISGRDFQIPPIHEIWIQNLTQDISPVTGPGVPAGVYAAGRGGNGPTGGDAGSPGPKLTLRYNDDHDIKPQGQGAGIWVETQGGKGHDGDGHSGPGNKRGSAGGGGGAGGDVTVAIMNMSSPNTRANISGQGAPAVLARRIGGHGGDGGNGTSAFWQGYGGDGGPGGKGGSILVLNTANLSTTGDNAQGILAASIGGNGGDARNGGGSRGGYGGWGKPGGNVGEVKVYCLGGKIETTGNVSFGIWAFSRAGRGGDGGNGSASKGKGGPGGQGGAGGNIIVSNVVASGPQLNTNITTRGDQSYGILAQSVGGRGGDGGKGKGISAAGGAAAGPGPGGNVLVDWFGNIETSGAGSGGVLAQSVAGFGGSGGSGSGLMAFGASGESGGPGGLVTVILSGEVKTKGGFADAICAQSIGGGGGNSANSMLSSLPDPKLINLRSLSVVVGGSGGSSGNGGGVTVDNRSAIQTGGKGSYGIMAQSLGGGGGIGGNANIGSDFKIGIGGSGGASGNGGQVNVINSGAITTKGDDAHGIYAQSVGGGGGIAGNVVRGVAFPVVHYQVPYTQYFGVGVGFGGKGGAGGKVTVASTGNIATQGNGAHGIFAQSVGGAGGLGGIDTGYPGRFIFNGSVWGGGAGAGGAVSVSETGNITTQGENAHAAGIKTWVSFEPVIDPDAVYRLLDQTHEFTDFYKVGRLNYHDHARTINWVEFREQIEARLRKLGKPYLLKKDLLAAK